MSVGQVVESWRGRVVDDAIFFRPNIPSRKLGGAIRTYAPGVSGDEVLVLVDNTVFGGAGDGMIITPSCFIGRDIGEAPVRVEIASVREVRLEEGILSRKIWINGNVMLVTLNCPGQPGVQALVGMMCEIVAGGAGAEPDLDPLAAPPPTHAADCQSCGAPIPPGEAACVYCGRGRG